MVLLEETLSRVLQLERMLSPAVYNFGHIIVASMPDSYIPDNLMTSEVSKDMDVLLMIVV